MMSFDIHDVYFLTGPDRGQCECGKCRCAGDYVGTNCGSRNCTIAAKDCIKDGVNFHFMSYH